MLNKGNYQGMRDAVQYIDWDSFLDGNLRASLGPI